jgi:hypothetical protein
VKRSGRDESIQVVIHMCREAMIGISLYSFPYLNWQKRCLSYYTLRLLFNKIGEEGRTASAWKRGRWGGEAGGGGKDGGRKGREMAQTM